MRKTNTIEQFILKANKIHNNKYDYSKTNYIDSKTKVCIICSIHGEFNQDPSNHLRGCGCPNCSNVYIPTTNEWIEKAKEIHCNKYIYNKVKYLNTYTKVTIVCPEHGNFKQTPANHLKGHGCPKCFLSNVGDKSSNTKEFINKAKSIHGNKYDYSKVNYILDNKKITIICKKHGEFLVTPNNHLNRESGCPRCKKSKGEIIIEDIFNKYNIVNEYQYRIPEVANELYYDFYLPDYNLLIEFHGKQHYEYIPFFHNNDRRWDLDAQKRRDDIIRYNARRWKYRYLEFNYKQLDTLTKDEFEQLLLKKLPFKKVIL